MDRKQMIRVSLSSRDSWTRGCNSSGSRTISAMSVGMHMHINAHARPHIYTNTIVRSSPTTGNVLVKPAAQEIPNTPPEALRSVRPREVSGAATFGTTPAVSTVFTRAARRAAVCCLVRKFRSCTVFSAIETGSEREERGAAILVFVHVSESSAAHLRSDSLQGSATAHNEPISRHTAASRET